MANNTNLTSRISTIRTADEAHELWLEAKRTLDREDQLAFWALLKEQRDGKNDFSGKPWRKAHPDAPVEAPAWVQAPAKPKHPVAPPKAPAKQEKAAPAKVKASPKAKEPTQKQMLANMLASMDGMDKAMRKLDSRMDSLEGKLDCLSAEIAGIGMTVKKLAK